MNRVFLQLGSNEGNSNALLQKAIMLINDHIGKVINQSAVYESEAWGNLNQNNFLNQVIAINTSMDPKELLHAVLKIENKLGRKRVEHWGPRTMDIDILFYENQIIKDEPELIVPHPRIEQRKFVLTPMNEIASEFIHPILKRSISQLLYLCEDSGKVWKIENN